MAQIKNIQINHAPILGSKHQRIFEKIDLSVRGEVSKKYSSDWFDYLSDLPVLEKEVVYYGGYLEKRFFYTNEELFGRGETRRDIHLGVDLWLPAHSEIFAPISGIVQSINYNDSTLDYGHTIILKHEVEDLIFYTLYGHLSSWHVKLLKENDQVNQGQNFCTLGPEQENGGWPPHLHFQIIMDLQKHVGDYPGVCNSNNLPFYKKNCPDPYSLII